MQDAVQNHCASLFDRLDWAATPLGPRAHWPALLRSTADLVLNSPIAMVLMWGPAHVMIYNDGYAGIAGQKHPQAFGGTHGPWLAMVIPAASPMQGLEKFVPSQPQAGAMKAGQVVGVTWHTPCALSPHAPSGRLQKLPVAQAPASPPQTCSPSHEPG